MLDDDSVARGEVGSRGDAVDGDTRGKALDSDEELKPFDHLLISIFISRPFHWHQLWR